MIDLFILLYFTSRTLSILFYDISSFPVLNIFNYNFTGILIIILNFILYFKIISIVLTKRLLNKFQIFLIMLIITSPVVIFYEKNIFFTLILAIMTVVLKVKYLQYDDHEH
jgi:hypothetical protein